MPWNGNKLAACFRKASPWIQYAYFLRFPCLMWALLPVLCLLDRSATTSLTRGILTLSSTKQAFFAFFFVVALSMAVLVCARNIVRNGRDRFGTSPPGPLCRLLIRPRRKDILWALTLALLPAAYTLQHVARLTISEGETDFSPHLSPHFGLWFGYACGFLAAVVFWYAVSVFYLWTFPHSPAPARTRPKPAALIFPEGLPLFDWAQNADKPWMAEWIERAARKALKWTWEGYSDADQDQLYELHTFAIIALGSVFLLYLFLAPLIAPIPYGNWHDDLIFAILIALALLAGCATKHEPESSTGPAEKPRWLRWPSFSRIGVAFSTVIVAGFCVFFYRLYRDAHANFVFLETAFPTLASLLVIFIFFTWFLSGASFFFDRYRIPVLTITLLVIFGPKWIPVDQDHYFRVIETSRLDASDTGSLTPTGIPRPADVVALRAADPDQPYIIVTATGGGIQAAAWTAHILARLESELRSVGQYDNSGNKLPGQARPYGFHDHLLLASGVSGGSVGLLPFMAEYTAGDGQAFSSGANQQSGDDPLTRRLTLAPECSSLEAVAWGLEYYDLQRLLLTVHLPWLQTTGDPGVYPDRTWALTEALNRNRSDSDCHNDVLTASRESLPESAKSDPLSLTGAAALLRVGKMPAFTFNTTVAETGGRFLLGNYWVPNDPLPKLPGYPLEPDSAFLPAASFLHTYTYESNCDHGQLKTKCYLDISLPTAARLSATFPVVSSATRIPKAYATHASHFLDGGYFDNDGTASVIEFLYSAFSHASQDQPLAANAKKPLKILLVEIRDGDDLNPTDSADDWNHQTGITVERGARAPSDWLGFTQFFSPLVGMWNANHVSVTRRNRRELCVLERSLPGLEIHHVVFGIPAQPLDGKPGQVNSPPLSWKLTQKQKAYIANWASSIYPNSPTQASIDDSLKWIDQQLRDSAAQPATASLSTPPEACTVMDQTYMRR